MQTPSIILKEVSAQQHGKTVLDNISFELGNGRHLAVIGESGSGKSSLAKVIAGKLFAKGTIEIQYTDNPALKSKTVLMEASPTFKNLSNVADFYYQQRYNSSDAGDTMTIEQELNKINSLINEKEILLDQLNLFHRKQTPLIQLSNGEQKKLQLIKVLLQKPQVLILNNVFIGLDVESRKSLHTIINQHASSGTTIIMVTDERELPSCITHIAEMYKGKLAQFAERKNFVAFHPENNEKSKKEQNAIPLFPGSVERFDCMVKMKKVSIQYGDKIILDNINWQVKKGERWLVKGHNGAGKSTLLSLITADNPQAYSKDIYLFDKKRGSGESIWDIKKHIGFVSPELHKFFDTGSSVHHVIASGFFDTIGLFRQLSAAQEKTINDWTSFFDLEEYINKPLFLLPAGQQRLALLARALIKNPALLVLDEPCQGLDDHQAKQFLNLIDEICNQSETTLIFVSHYDDEIPRCITNKLELQQGKQIALYKEQTITV
ncbi:MAG: ATP-binding cassette domain-containing protein [Chitinophagaceae bacterium]